MGHTYNIEPATTLDYRRLSEKRLPRFLFDYIDGGANDEVTLAENVSDFLRIRIRQNVLHDVSTLDTASTIAGESVAMPVVLAPVGMAGMFARRGETLAVRAADRAGIPFTLSTVGICPVEEVRKFATKPFWFQLYMLRDRAAVRSILERVARAGVTTLAFTVDLPLAGMRHRDTRNGMMSKLLPSRLGRAWQLGTRLSWCFDVGVRGKPHTCGNISEMVADPTDLQQYKNWVDTQFDPSVTWKDIEWLRGLWNGKLFLKGIQELRDATRALEVGADGIVVSNHGGRQLDGVASSISKLPAIADALGDRLEVLMDGGVRSGLDVFKAVALGAKGVMIGRPWVWAMSGAGEAGLDALLATFKREMQVAMALSGVARVADIDRGHIDQPPNTSASGIS
jgi:L-lactate dehydrogenase (cytochrome)